MYGMLSGGDEDGRGRGVGYLNWLDEIDLSRSRQVRSTFAESPDRHIMRGS